MRAKRRPDLPDPANESPDLRLPVLTLGEHDSPSSTDECIAIQLPQAIIPTSDLELCCNRGRLGIKSDAADTMLANSVLYIPKIHPVLQSCEELSTSSKGEDVVNDDRNIDLLKEHLRSGRWIWIVSLENEGRVIDVGKTRDLEMARYIYFRNGNRVELETFCQMGCLRPRTQWQIRREFHIDVRSIADLEGFIRGKSSIYLDRLIVRLSQAMDEKANDFKHQYNEELRLLKEHARSHFWHEDKVKEEMDKLLEKYFEGVIEHNENVQLRKPTRTFEILSYSLSAFDEITYHYFPVRFQKRADRKLAEIEMKMDKLPSAALRVKEWPKDKRQRRSSRSCRC